MALRDEAVQELSIQLECTLSPSREVRVPAEQALRNLQSRQNFGLLLLASIENDNANIQTRIAGAIHFKNFVKEHWKVVEEKDNVIHVSDREQIKASIVDIMLKAPSSVQKQLSTAIAIIGQEDFPLKWPTLIQSMQVKFASGDFHVINGVLQTAASIFEKYSFEMKSQKLWEEIKFVLDNFAQPFTNLLVATMDLGNQHASNPVALKVIYGSLVNISKIFYYLNYQDLPEFFEDNMKLWMTHFHSLLVSNQMLLETQDDDEPGVLEELKSQICDNIGLYAHKYEEEFSPYMQQFVTAVWNLLLSMGPQIKYDSLASNAIQFLASVADRQQYKSLFEDPNVLGSICEKVIVPNIEMRQCDVELFEDNAEEYIRRDLEGSDVDTRRRAACDLVKGLSRYFEAQITEIFGAYVKRMLDHYDTNPSAHWKSKDAAIYLVTSLATRAKTAKHGITQTNQLVDLTDFYSKYILPELEDRSKINDLPVIRSSAIKYLLTFRSQLPPLVAKTVLPNLIVFLRAESQVTHTYAAAAIDKILIIKSSPEGGQTRALITSQDLAPLSEELLAGLFGAFTLPGSTENEYVMKCVMRSFSTLQDALIPFLATLLPNLTQKLQQAAKNPTRPHYNHYLFESLSLSIKIVCRSQPQAVSNFETVLFPVFQEILQSDVQEFIPYTFQILSVLLELRSGPIPQVYMDLFSFLLMPALWDRPGNISPLVRLLQAYVRLGSDSIINMKKLEPLLGVFQKLIASKSNDHEGFYLMQTMIEVFSCADIQPYILNVFRLLFTRLTSSKTTKYVKHLIVFLLSYVMKYDGNSLEQVVDAIQPGMFGMVLERLIVLEVQKVNGSRERKICAFGMIKLLCGTDNMLEGKYSSFWVPTLQALVGLFELPEDDSVPESEHFVEIENTPGYQSTYSQLVFACKQQEDNLAQLDGRIELAKSISRCSTKHPGKLLPLINQMQEAPKQFLQSYLAKAGMNLN